MLRQHQIGRIPSVTKYRPISTGCIFQFFAVSFVALEVTDLRVFLLRDQQRDFQLLSQHETFFMTLINGTDKTAVWLLLSPVSNQTATIWDVVIGCASKRADQQ